MKTILLEEPYNIAVKHVDPPVLQAGQALIRVKAIGICGSDVNYYKGASQSPLSFPLILGHEISGEVIEADFNSEGINPGDRVVISPYSYCGQCYPCSIGKTNCCSNIKVYGTHIDGCMSEVLNHPIKHLCKASGEVSYKELALAEPLAIALHGMNRLRIAAGEHLVIIGAGAIGMISALAAEYYGAIPIMLDIEDRKLEFAKNCGFKHVINPLKQDAAKYIGEITEGCMAQAVMEVSGAVSSIKSCFNYVSNAGRVIFTGWAKAAVELDTKIITRKEIDVLGARNTTRSEISEAIRLISMGCIDIAKVITKEIAFDDIPKTIAAMADHPEENIKVVAVL
jgi:L-gulonate 5-dehydrogenase